MRGGGGQYAYINIVCSLGAFRIAKDAKFLHADNGDSIGVALITHLTPVRSMRKKNNIICNKETSSNIKLFFPLP